MNSFSISKLSSLVQSNGHILLETFVYKNHVRYLTLFCKRYRHIFLMEIRNIPISYDGEKVISTIHKSYGLYQIEKPNLQRADVSSSYPITTNHHIDESRERYTQKQRLDILLKHDIFSIVFINESKIWHGKHFFQIENFQYQEYFQVICISLDDYYLQQSSISVAIHDKYSKFTDFVSKNVKNQIEHLSTFLKNEQNLEKWLQLFNNKINKFTIQFHQASTIFDRTLQLQDDYQAKSIQILYNLFRKHSQFLLQFENLYFNTVFHVQGLKDSLQFND